DVEGVDAAGAVEALREHALEDVAGCDVLLGAADGLEERGLGGARGELQLGLRCGARMLLAGLGQRAGKALLQALEALERARVGLGDFPPTQAELGWGTRRGVAGGSLPREVGGDDEVDL